MISDVVPVKGAVGNNGLRRTHRPFEIVSWVKMISTDALGEETLVIGLGFGDGIQLFALSTNGEARTILSWRNSGPVRDFCVLPHPAKENQCENDAYGMARPLVALCELNRVSIISMSSPSITNSCNCVAHRVVASRCALVVTTQLRIAVYAPDSSFNLLFDIPLSGAVALGHRWLAYANKSLSPQYATPGGLASDDLPSVTGTVMLAAKSIKSGLTRLGELTGSGSPPRRTNVPFGQGIVSVVDVLAKDSPRMLLHFQAHRDPVAAMVFDAPGNLLATADTMGRKFHVFRLLPHPGGSTQSKVDHLYVLYRGETSASVWDMHFSLDSRWMSVCTARGTLHVFPISPYGGKATVRTHLSDHVVNRLTSYQITAGVDIDHDMPQIVNPAIQIRHNLTNEESEVGLRKDGMLLSMAFSSGRASCLANNKGHPPVSTKDSLFAVTTSGILHEYILNARSRIIEGTTSVAVSSESGFEVSSTVVAQWPLLSPNVTPSNTAPLPPPAQKTRKGNQRRNSEIATTQSTGCWMSQVEIITYAEPLQRLWKGNRFTFVPNFTKNGQLPPKEDNGLIEVSNNELVVEHLAEAMNETCYRQIHSSVDSIYHSPSQSSEHLPTIENDSDFS